VSKLLGVPPRHRLVIWALSLLLVLGCQQVRFVSPYDEIVDRGTSALHTKIASFVGRMVALSGKPEGTYSVNEAVYPEFTAEISTLRLHAAATPKNEITLKQFDELKGNVERLRKLHQLGGDRGLRKLVADPALAAIDINCGAIIHYEVAKKRGDS
jgi:hypothetical protein